MRKKDKGGARVSILYFSGAGGTRLVAELLGEILTAKCECRVTDVNDPASRAHAADSDFLAFCYPTYFLKPAPSMREFIQTLGPFDPPRTAYIVTTYELYCENSLRACALSLQARGIAVTGAMSIRAPGSDLTCLLPSRLCSWLYRFEKDFTRKLASAADEILACMGSRGPPGFIPAPKWYAPFSRLLQVLILDRFEGCKGGIRVLPQRCTSCGACVRGCHRKAWRWSGDVLLHVPEGCELCTRCIHRCPGNAIVLLRCLEDNPRLDARLYARLKEDARGRLRVGG